MFELGKAQGRETRGIADHGFIESIYFRDPNGYVIELTAPTQQAGAILSKGKQDARGVLSNWQATKPAAVSE